MSPTMAEALSLTIAISVVSTSDGSPERTQEHGKALFAMNMTSTNATSCVDRRRRESSE